MVDEHPGRLWRVSVNILKNNLELICDVVKQINYLELICDEVKQINYLELICDEAKQIKVPKIDPWRGQTK
jgi:hypothetical protein